MKHINQDVTSSSQIRNRTNSTNGGNYLGEKPPLIDSSCQKQQTASSNKKGTNNRVLIFIGYMIKLLKKMSFLFEILNPSKKGRLAPIQDDILLTPANKLSARIKQGHLSSYELVSRYIERIKSVQPHINAVVEENFDEALKEAQTIDSRLKTIRERCEKEPQVEIEKEEDRLLWQSPLVGVPISVKESIAVKGMKSTAGLAYRKDSRASKDSVVVENIRKLGLIPVVTTNVPELTMYWADCRNPLYGRTCNPYDLARVPGASSGGEGSLIGAGGSLIGIGSDIGGSLRLPAQMCGIFSHKPSPYSMNTIGNFPAMQPRRLKLFTFGPMTRYASDLRPLLKCLLLDHQPLVSPPANGCCDTLQQVEQNFQENDVALNKAADMKINSIDELDIKLLPLDLDTPVVLKEITLLYCDFSDTKLRPAIKPRKEILDGMHEVVQHFSTKHNCCVKQVDLDKFYRYAMKQWHIMMRTNPDSNPFEEMKQQLGMGSLPLEWLKLLFGASSHTKESMFAVWLSSQAPSGPVKGPEIYEKFMKINTELKREFYEMLGQNSVLIVPTLPAVAYKHNEALTKTDEWISVVLFNIMCCPTTHATFGLDKENKMPFGFSISARPGLDRLTLAVAEEIEARFGGWQPPTSA